MGKKNISNFFSIFNMDQRLLNKIAREEAAEIRRNEELRAIYLKRKAHYDKIYGDITLHFGQTQLSSIKRIIEDIFRCVVDIEEKKYYRKFDSLDDIVDFYKKDPLISEYKELVTIDFIAMDIAAVVMPYENWKIGEHILGEMDRFELFRITNKDVIYVLSQIGFKNIDDIGISDVEY